MNQQNSDANSSVSGMVPSVLLQTSSDLSVLAGSSSVASDHGNNSPDEISELGIPWHGRDNSEDPVLEASTSEHNVTDPMATSVKYGIFNRTYILENLDKFSQWRIHTGREKSIVGRDKHADNISKAKSFLGDGTESLHELEYQRLDGHVRRLSTESIGSDLSSVRASEISNLGVGNLFGDDSLDLHEGAGIPKMIDAHVSSDSQFARDILVALPSDERHKLNRVLNTIRQRLATAKTDMEDLIARLNQEVAVRQFLTTKVCLTTLIVLLVQNLVYSCCSVELNSSLLNFKRYYGSDCFSRIYLLPCHSCLQFIEMNQ